MPEHIEKRTNVFWFVGAAFGGNRDQTQRFLDEGIWENGSKDRYIDTVRSMQSGDRIAIKGLNGSGKTTLFNVITGIYKPTIGQVVFNNKSVIIMAVSYFFI